MKTDLTIKEKVVAILLLLIGVLFTVQAINGYISSYIIHYISPDSYRISMTTYISNLINGNLLIISSLFFFYKKSVGALLYQYTGISFILYAINLDLFDWIAYHSYDKLTILVSAFILMPFGLFLFLYFKKKNSIYKSKYLTRLLVASGAITYLYVNLFFCDWLYFVIK